MNHCDSTAPVVPLNDLSREVRFFGGRLEAAAKEVVQSGWYLSGTHTDRFCGLFADYVGTTYCVGVGNGTDAIEIALRAVGVRAGSEVVTVGNAGMYSSVAIVAVGATPVLVDIDPRSHLATPEGIADALSARTSAVIVTHLYGAPANVPAIVELAKSHGIAVIEDCAQAHGAQIDGRRVGSFGDAAAFSFYPTKNLGALGDAGAIVTSSADVAENARAYAQYGWIKRKYESVVAGGRNSRMDEIQAAVLEAKLSGLEELNSRRRRVHSAYADCLDCGDSIRLLHAGTDTVAHLAVFVCSDRRRVRDTFTAAGVQTAVHYPVPDHLQPALAGRCRIAASMEVTEAASEQVLTIPCHPFMTEEEIQRVCDVLRGEC